MVAHIAHRFDDLRLRLERLGASIGVRCGLAIQKAAVAATEGDEALDCQRCAAGESFKYLYFWGHRPATDDKVGKSCFSQWYEASFKLDGVRYPSAEHYMMAAKARLFDDPRLLERILADEFADVTFSGGDPMFQPEAFARLARSIKEKSRKTIWCYTGYTFERLLDNPKQAELLKYIDVLVDGKFKQALRDESLLFRGSSNQRLIDVKASLKANKTVLLELNYDL